MRTYSNKIFISLTIAVLFIIPFSANPSISKAESDNLTEGKRHLAVISEQIRQQLESIDAGTPPLPDPVQEFDIDEVSLPEPSPFSFGSFKKFINILVGSFMKEATSQTADILSSFTDFFSDLFTNKSSAPKTIIPIKQSDSSSSSPSDETTAEINKETSKDDWAFMLTDTETQSSSSSSAYNLPPKTYNLPLPSITRSEVIKLIKESDTNRQALMNALIAVNQEKSLSVSQSISSLEKKIISLERKDSLSSRQLDHVYNSVSRSFDDITSLDGVTMTNSSFSGTTGTFTGLLTGTTGTFSGLLTLNANLLMSASAYLNFGSAEGTSGYGFRDNSGVMQFKNSGGSWTTISPSQWGSNGSDTYYTIGNVGIGTTTPWGKLSTRLTSGTTDAVGRFQAAVGGYTGTSLIAENTLGADSAYRLFEAATDADGDAGGRTVQFVIRGDGNVGIGTTSPYAKLSVVGETVSSYFTATTSAASTFPYASSTALTVSGNSWFNSLSTMTNLLLTGSTTLQNFTANNSTTTNATTTNIAVSGNTYIGSLNGPLQANNGLVSATTSVGYQYGGTGLTSAPSFGQILRGTGTGYALVATSTLGINTADITEGSNLFWTNNRFDNRLSATTTLPNLTTLLGLTNATTTNLTSANSWLGNILSGTWNGTAIGDSYLTKSGDWTGTLDGQEGSYYLNASNLANFGSPFYTYFNATTTDALAQGSTNKYWSNTLFDNRLSATTTLPNITTLLGLTNATTTGLTVTSNAYFPGSGIWNSLGNVGIGTTTPSFGDAKVLQITGSPRPVIRLTRPGGSEYIIGTEDVDDKLRIVNSTGVTLPRDSTKGIIIDTAGNVGIGEVSPGSKLSVSGGATIGASYDTTVAPSNGMIVEGNVGIGTTTPGANLNISASRPTFMLSNTEANAGTFRIKHYNDSSGFVMTDNVTELTNSGDTTASTNYTSRDGALIRSIQGTGMDNNTYMQFGFVPAGAGTTISPKIHINGYGNVGIGTTTPGYKLDVYGTSGQIASFGQSGAGVSDALMIDASGSLSDLGSQVYVNDDLLVANTSQLTGVTGIGVGPTTANRLHVQHSTGLTTASVGKFEAAIVGYTGTSLVAANTLGPSSTYNLFSAIADSDGDGGGPTTQFVVRGDGNVGIGTTTPQALLSTEGTFRLGDYNNSNNTFNKLGASTYGGSIQGVQIGGYGSDSAFSPYLTVVTTAGGSTGGNIGIGTTTPGSRLSVTSGLSVGANYGAAAPSNGAIIEGNVGIGTTNPAVKIHAVAGADTWAGDFQGLSTSDKVRLGTYSGKATIGANNSTGSSWSDLLINPGGGNVGIGTTTPDRTLHVVNNSIPPVKFQRDNASLYSAGSVYNDLRLTNANTTNNNTAGIGFTSFDTSGNEIDMAGIGSVFTSHAPGAFAGDLLLLTTTGGTSYERMRILANGNVGIGTTTPGTILHVYNGEIRNEANGSNDVNISMKNGNRQWNMLTEGAASRFLLRDVTGGTYPFIVEPGATSDSLYIKSSGNVGIGTTTPGSKLSVTSGLSVGANYGVAAPNNGAIIEGDVGIGTTDTSHANLTIRQSADDAYQLFLAQNNLSLGNGYLFRVDMTDGALAFVSNQGGVKSERMRILANGTVAIGTTTPLAGAQPPKLTIEASTVLSGTDGGQIYIQSPTDINKGMRMGYDTTNDFGFIAPVWGGTGYKNLALTPNGGNVGIGTTTPGAQLHVSGANSQSAIIEGTGDDYVYSYLRLKQGTAANWWDFYHRKDNPNALTFEYNNVPKVTFASSGNVGIGTTTPQNKLHIVSPSYGGIRIDRTGGDSNTRNWFLSTSNQVEGDFNILQSNAAGGDPWNAGTSRLYIKNDGFVGLGLTGPTAKLGLNGNLSFEIDTSNTTKGLYWKNGTDGQYGQMYRDSSNGHMYIDSQTGSPLKLNTTNTSGSVYLGPSTYFAGNKLNIFPTATNLHESLYLSNNLNASLRLNHDSSISRFGTDGSQGIAFATNGTTTALERMRITSDGNVGIGTTTPATKLEVAGGYLRVDHSSAPQLQFAKSSSQKWSLGAVDGSTDKFHIFEEGGAGSSGYRMTIDTAGNVGIGDTSPDALLDVKGTVCLDLNADEACTDNTSAISDARLKNNVSTITDGLSLVNQLRPVRFTWNGEYNTGTSPSLGFIAQEVETVFPELVITDTAGYKNLDYSKLTAVVAGATQTLDARTKWMQNATTSTILTVDSTGNIGIGTTSPAYKLQVMGDIAATSFVNTSTREAKKDISHISSSQETDFLDKIKNTSIASYHYNIEDRNNPLRLGLIAEEAPKEILSVDGKGVDVYKMATFTLGGVKALQKEIEKMKIDLTALSAGAASSGTGTDGLFTWITDKFKAVLGITFENEKVKVKNLCVGETCVTEEQFKAVFGNSQSTSSSSSVSGGSGGAQASSGSSSSSTAESSSSSSAVSSSESSSGTISSSSSETVSSSSSVTESSSSSSSSLSLSDTSSSSSSEASSSSVSS